jgi:hypothetical protein
MNKRIILIGSIILVFPFLMLMIDAVSGDYRDSFLNRLID